jgi:hypothetical protein
MSVYVGIDVHRKRSHVAVVDQSGEVLTNRNVPNGAEPILKVIGGLPPGTPAAFEAAFGWGVAGGAAGGLRVRPAPGAHPLRCKANRLGAAEERQGPAPRSARSCCAPTCCRRRTGTIWPRSPRELTTEHQGPALTQDRAADLLQTQTAAYLLPAGSLDGVSG